MNRTIFISAVVFLAGMFTGCVPSQNPDIERGSNFQYREGYPEVRLNAIGLLNEENRPVIHVTADIVKGSLIYEQQGSQFRADFNTSVRIYRQDEEGETVVSESYPANVAERDTNIVHSQELYTFDRRFEVEPGHYHVELTVTDGSSQNRTTRTLDTFIPDPENNVTNLTNIQLQIKDVDSPEPEWTPATTYDIPGKVDSLKFVFQVTNNKSEDPMVIESRLVRFESDTSVARDMYSPNYGSSSIQHKGIDYDETSVLQTTERRLSQPGSVFIEFAFERQPRGNYRFEVRTLAGESGEGTEFEGVEVAEGETFKGRSYSIKSENYPAIQTPRELARPLAYLMDDREYEEMIATQDPDSLKQYVDRFWLQNIQNPNRARSVIRMYYERVEQANKKFSNFKEGWKTDRGMIYILFGPPWYVDEYFNQRTWSYSHNRNDPEYNFTFRQPQVRSELHSFNNYLLQRNRNLYDIQYRQIQRWLSGSILTRSI